jgi:hypothetical protein
LQKVPENLQNFVSLQRLRRFMGWGCRSLVGYGRFNVVFSMKSLSNSHNKPRFSLILFLFFSQLPPTQKVLEG